MASKKVISDRILDTYQKGFFGDNNNKYSNVILSHEANRILEVIDNDSILYGLNIEKFYLSENKREVVVKVSPGRLVQDRTLVEIIESVTLTLPIFKEYDIRSVDTSDNYFTFNNDVQNDFPELSEFAVIESTGNDKNDWTVKETSYDNDSDVTYVYVTGNIENSTSDGKAICRKYVDSFETDGRVVVNTNYQFLEDLRESRYPLKLELNYLDRDNKIPDGWSSNLKRIVLGVLEFQRNTENTEIVEDSLEKIEKINDILIEDTDYIPGKRTTIVEIADAGNINVEV
ncbi:MAG: hypothetical protein ACOC22_02440 [bacterium]